MPVPEHVFLSHAAHDAEHASRLSGELEAAGIPIWIDSSRLTPGTPDWETAIREGISRSYVMLVLASPEASASRFVRAELALAEAMGCQIFPLWIRGEKWIECIPLSLSHTQYIDMRGDRWALAVKTAIATMSAKIAELAPDHYLVSPLWVAHREYRNSWSKISPPRGYLSIELSRLVANDAPSFPPEDGGRAAFFRLAKFSSVWELLDTLFIHYLATDLQPYTYGRDWVLREDHPVCGRVLLPWAALWSATHNPPHDNLIFRDTSLESAGLDGRRGWQMSAIGSFKPIGLAVHEPEILEVLRRSPKALYGFRNAEILTRVSAESVTDDFTHRLVVWFSHDWDKTLTNTNALIQSGTDSAQLEFWLRYW